MNRDYIFDVSWEDRRKESYIIGVLAKIDNYFYLLMNKTKNGEAKTSVEMQLEKAYFNGYNDIPGFTPGQVYKSSEMFDFFKNRVLNTSNERICKELSETCGISMVDSFSVHEIIDDAEAENKKSILLEIYNLQLQLQQNKENDAR